MGSPLNLHNPREGKRPAELNATMKRHTLRVYGLLVNQEKVLISHEHYYGRTFVKFPGGGLEFGEGHKEALVREFLEELNLSVEVGSMVYTTTEAVISAFDPQVQVWSSYYWVRATAEDCEKITTVPLHSPAPSEPNSEHFMWLPLREIGPEIFTFPLEQEVARIVQKEGHSL